MRNSIFYLVFLCLSSFVYAQTGGLSVKEFGAVGDGATDDRNAIQRCLDQSGKEKKACKLPAGTYKINGSLYLSNNSSIQGDGVNSVLSFSSGSLLGMKNGSKEFYYTNNYINEVVPNEMKTTASANAKINAKTILVKDASIFKVGDQITIFNAKRDSWKILEDQSKRSLWNANDISAMARGGSFCVESIANNKIILNKTLPFAIPIGAEVRRRAGVINASIENLKIIANNADFCISIEQPNNLRINRLNLVGKGGVLLSHFANNCLVSNSKIVTSNNAAIIVENFSSENMITNNEVNYTKGSKFVSGSDAAIILIMSSYNNQITNNRVVCNGNKDKDEGGVFVHALCYDNKVSGNNISGASDGIGCFYGAFNNRFINNTITDVKVGVTSYYSRKNQFISNKVSINSKRGGNKIGALVFQSNDIKIQNNQFNGLMTFGIQLQGSVNEQVSQNMFTNQSEKAYSIGLKSVGRQSQTGLKEIVKQNNFAKFKHLDSSN